MRNYLLTLLSAVLLSIGSGCVLTPRTVKQTAYYDLPLPQAVKQVNFLQITAINNDTPAQSRMLFRLKDNRIVQDNLNCWIQPPERILQRYLTQAFRLKNNTAKIIELRCTINAFEFDAATSEAVLSFNCIFKYNAQRKAVIFTIREKFNSPQPDELVKAMTRATEKLTEQIAQQALEISK